MRGGSAIAATLRGKKSGPATSDGGRGKQNPARASVCGFAYLADPIRQLEVLVLRLDVLLKLLQAVEESDHGLVKLGVPEELEASGPAHGMGFFLYARTNFQVRLFRVAV